MTASCRRSRTSLWHTVRRRLCIYIYCREGKKRPQACVPCSTPPSFPPLCAVRRLFHPSSFSSPLLSSPPLPLSLFFFSLLLSLFISSISPSLCCVLLALHVPLQGFPLEPSRPCLVLGLPLSVLCPLLSSISIRQTSAYTATIYLPSCIFLYCPRGLETLL